LEQLISSIIWRGRSSEIKGFFKFFELFNKYFLVLSHRSADIEKLDVSKYSSTFVFMDLVFGGEICGCKNKSKLLLIPHLLGQPIFRKFTLN